MNVTINKNAIYCPPKLVKQKIYSGEEMISGKRLNEINDWMTAGDNFYDFMTTALIGSAIAVIVDSAVITSSPFAIALAVEGDKILNSVIKGSIESAAAYAAYKLFYRSSDISYSFLKSVKNNLNKNIKVKYTFTYRRHGSNDGAYFLTNLEFTH